MRYSLADYILTITPPKEVSQIFSEISIGGKGQYVGSINITHKDNLYEVDSYATGAYVFNKNLSRVGTISVNLNQLCNEVAQLKQLVSALFENDYSGFTISVYQSDNTEVASCSDCYPVKIPDQVMEATAQMQQWQFLAGVINIE